MKNMKNFAATLILILLTAFTGTISAPVSADATYPYATPTYVPNIIGGVGSYSAPADYYLTINNIGTAVIRVSGTCTSLASTVRLSNDTGSQLTGGQPTNWTTATVYPYPTAGTASPTPAASIAAAGLFKINSVGMTRVNLHITALTASCVVQMTGGDSGFNGSAF